MRPNIAITDLRLDGPTEVKVLLFQFSTKEEDFRESRGLLYLSEYFSESSAFEKFLSLVAEHMPNLVVLPELIPDSASRARLRAITESNDSLVVVAGTSYHEKGEQRISRAHAYIRGIEYLSDKITPSPYERNAFAPDSLSRGKDILLFKNTPAGNFGILICSDLLDEDCRACLLENDIDVLVVPACQPRSTTYFEQFGHICRQHTSGLYIVYANLDFGDYGDGQSSLFGNVNNIFVRSFPSLGLSDLKPPQKIWEAQGDEDWMLARLDLEHKRVELPNSTFTEPNISILETRRSKHIVPVRTGKYKLIAFDVNGPLVRGLTRTHSWLAVWGYLNDDTTWRLLLSAYKAGRLSYSDWCKTATHIFKEKGIDRHIISHLAKSAKLVSNFQSGINKLRSANYVVGIISGGIDMYLRHHVPDYESNFDFSVINKFLFDGEQRIADVDVLGKDYEDKANALIAECKKWRIELSASIYVGDQSNDDSVLSAAGYSIIFSSDDSSQHLRHDKVILDDDFEVLVDHILSLG